MTGEIVVALQAPADPWPWALTFVLLGCCFLAAGCCMGLAKLLALTGPFLHAQSRNGRRGVQSQPSFRDFMQANNTVEQRKGQPLSLKDFLQGLDDKNGDCGDANWARNRAKERGPANTQPLQNAGTRASRRSLCHPYQTGLRLLHASGTDRKPRPGESNGLPGKADLVGLGQREQERILGGVR